MRRHSLGRPCCDYARRGVGARQTKDELARELELARAREREAQELLAHAQARLAETEQRLSRAGELELELRDLGASHELLIAERDALQRRLDALQRTVSWRVTAPLRRLKPGG